MYKYFGKEVCMVEPTLAYRIHNKDGSLWSEGNSWWLSALKVGEKWYAVADGSFLGPDGKDLGGWHKIFVQDVEIEPGTTSLLDRILVLIKVKKWKEPVVRPIVFGTLGSVTNPIPQDILDQALSTTDKDEVLVYGPNNRFSYVTSGDCVEDMPVGSAHMHHASGPRRHHVQH